MSLNKLSAYFRPKKLSEAAELLKENEGFYPMGGGTWLIPNGGDEIKGIIDLSDAGFKEIRLEHDLLHIGAGVTLHELATSPETSAKPYSTLRRAINFRGRSRLLLTSSTVGGRVALAKGDSSFLAALVAADAQVIIYGNIKDDISVWEYVTDSKWRTNRNIITAVEIINSDQPPLLAIESINYIPSAPPVISVVVGIEISGDTVGNAKIVYSSLHDNLVRAMDTEQLLLDKVIDEKLINSAAESILDTFQPLSDARASSTYKKEMAAVLLKRSLNRIRERVG
ncbi:MAG: FAD binding domain-containing protein [Candidatus Marinimicrobia bacterium]|nr:FAD binding domain-containing protein [Candidatus Neomarinimicrobiota bacterium]